MQVRSHLQPVLILFAAIIKSVCETFSTSALYSLHNDIATCEASVTSCETLIARTGSIVLSSVHQGRIPSVYSPVHVCVAYTSQLV